jgi:hypothetical protein
MQASCRLPRPHDTGRRPAAEVLLSSCVVVCWRVLFGLVSPSGPSVRCPSDRVAQWGLRRWEVDHRKEVGRPVGGPEAVRSRVGGPHAARQPWRSRVHRLPAAPAMAHARTRSRRQDRGLHRPRPGSSPSRAPPQVLGRAAGRHDAPRTPSSAHPPRHADRRASSPGSTPIETASTSGRGATNMSRPTPTPGHG